MTVPLPPLLPQRSPRGGRQLGGYQEAKPRTPGPPEAPARRPLAPLRLVSDFGGCDCDAGGADDPAGHDCPPSAAAAAQLRRDYAADAIRRAKEKREGAAAKKKREKALKDMVSFRARQKVLATFTDEELREHAIGRSGEEPPPELLAPLSGMPLRPRLTLAMTHSASATSLQGARRHSAEPKIDFHQHCMTGDEEGLQALLAANAEWGVERCVLLSLRLIKSSRSDVRGRNDWVLEMAKRYPEVVPFVTVIEDDPFASKMFRECLDRGARGLKLIGWHSEYIRKHDYDLCNPALMDVFRLAAARHVPVLLHLWVGYSKTKRDYHQSLDQILTELPGLRLVLAHFGLGFDPESLPGIIALAERHRNLYVDTSLYGSNCELWFTRGSNQAGPLSSFVRRFPKQVLFGTDVFGSRLKQPKELAEAMAASISFLAQGALVCEEFKVTEYFARTREDKYGLVAFDPMRLQGLQLADDPELLRRVFRENALEILDMGAARAAGG